MKCQTSNISTIRLVEEMTGGCKRKAIVALSENRPKPPTKGKYVDHGDGYIMSKADGKKEPVAGTWRAVVYGKEKKREWGGKRKKTEQFAAACELIEEAMRAKLEQ